MINLDDGAERRLREIIREEVGNTISPIRSEIMQLRRDLTEHEHFRFAHGWDHDQITQNQALLNEWNLWRRNVDKWRWTQAGAIAFIAAEVPIVVALFVALFHH